jgi:hypothetical protein
MAACPIVAQTVSGTLTGTVYDANGAALKGAHVEVRDASTNFSISSVTNDTGGYTVTNLQPDTYQITVSMPGFKTSIINNAVLLTNQVARNDFHLEVGGATETVAVNATASVISTENSPIASVIDSHAVDILLVNGRTVDQLLATVSGSTSDGALTSTPNLAGSLRWGGVYYTVDGGTFNDLGNGSAAYSYSTNLTTMPSLDTLEEVKVQTNMANAEYEGGSAISMVTKSGTNRFHGSLVEFNRNRALSAFTYFTSPGSTKPTFNRNEFGGTIGGPIRKDKTFFFGSYEGFLERQASYDVSTVPTNPMRTGDFTALLALSTPIVLTNPATGLPFPTSNVITSGGAAIDSRATALLSYYPQPTAGLTGLVNNFNASIAAKYDTKRISLKIDQILKHNNTLTLGGGYSDGNPYFVARGTPPTYGNWSDAGYITQSAFVRDVAVLSQTLVNEARFGYFSHRSVRVGQNTGYNPATLFSGLYYQAGMIGGLPTLNMNDANYSYQNLGDYGGAGHAPETTLQITDNLTKQLGHHTLKAGLSLNFNAVDSKPGTNSSVLGTFNFDGTYTGNSFADFLLGDVYSDTRAAATVPVNLRYEQYGFYVQDDWKVIPRLTLNYGLRYSFQTVPNEGHGDMTNFDYQTGQLVIRTSGGKMGSGVNQTILGQYPYTTSEAVGWGSQVITADMKDFGPRLGFAYRLTGDSKTVLRGGYGIFYNFIPMYIGINQLAQSNYPFTLSQTFSSATTTTPSLTLANPFFTTPKVTANPTIFSVDHNPKNARVQQWNLTLEQRLPDEIGLRISWVGNKTTQAPWYLYQMNYPVVQTQGAVQANRPYQPWGTIYGLVTKGAAETNELQIEATKRYSHGLYLQASYTWDKSLNNVPISSSPQNPYNPAGDRGLADGVFQQNTFVNASWDIPLRGHGVLGGAITGWTLAGMAQLRGGMPFTPTFTAVTQSSYTGWLATRPDVVPGVNPYAGGGSIKHWFNPAAFTRPAPFTYGNARRNSLLGPHQDVVNLSVQKLWSVREHYKLTLRMDAFNAFNHTSFWYPSANISNTSSVGIITGTDQDNREVQLGGRLTF